MPKRVTSSLLHLRDIATASYTDPLEEISPRPITVGNTVSDLRFEPQTSRSETNALPLDQLAGANVTQLQKHRFFKAIQTSLSRQSIAFQTRSFDQPRS